MDGTVQEKIKAELGKIKTMTLKEKTDYIWEYYKIPIIIFIIFILIVGSIVNSILHPPKKTFAQLAIYGPYIDSTITEKLSSDISELIVDDTENYTVYATNFYENEADPEVNMAMQQKFFAMIATKEIDVIIGAEENIGALAVEGTLLELSEDIIKSLGFEPPIIPDELTDSIISDFLVTPTVNEDKPKPYAIMLHDSKIMLQNNLNADGYFMGIVVNSMRVDEAVLLMNSLLQ